MKIVSWNTNHRRLRAIDQAAALLSRRPDVVALQEVTLSSAPILTAALSDGGLAHVRTTIDATAVMRGPRSYGVLLASKYRLASDVVAAIQSPWSEKVLSTRVDSPEGPVELHTVHVPPGSSNGWIKVDVLESIFGALARPCDCPRILCGDFNTPQCELQSGEPVTWAQEMDASGVPRLRARFRGGLGTRWDTAERNVLCGLREFEMYDVYRTIHGYEHTASSWVFVRHQVSVARRFDHIFASDHFRPIACSYLHELRGAGLSDHAPIEAELELRSPCVCSRRREPPRPKLDLPSRNALIGSCDQYRSKP